MSNSNSNTPEAEVEYSQIIPTKVEVNKKSGKVKTFRKNFRNVPTQNIITDFQDIPTAEKKLYEGKVKAVTYKTRTTPPKSKTRRFINKIKKILKIKDKKLTENVLTELDFDTTFLKDTCLEEIALTIIDIQIMKNFIKEFANPVMGQNEIKNNAQMYCDTRKKLLEIDPYFYSKYPNIFYVTLKFALDDKQQSINDMIDTCHGASETELILTNMFFRRPHELMEVENRLLPQTTNIQHLGKPTLSTDI